MPLAPGHRLASYEIVSALGSGGMGDVYRARDARLGRDVALKVLPPDVTNEPGRLERFDREARAIAALNHPHIVTIFSTEEADGIRFLTMELVDGKTLGDLITPSGVAVATFLDLSIPLADALSAAHQKQITHRDLKPGNVMVTADGRVKVLDFGLARMESGDAAQHSMVATQAPITHHGTIVGTMPYMSPEQVEGRSLDARTDLFSLGVIFHELLSGERPFKGPSSAALMSSILRDAPPSLSDRRSDLPGPVVSLVERLLEKHPDDRWQTARDVFNELRHIRKQVESGSARPPNSSRATPALQNLSIAVLPFTVRGPDADAEAMADGLTDDVTTSLAKFQGLSVTASQATRAYKGSPLDVRQIAERVNARYVISGNVRKAGTTLRTTAQLIDARSGEQLWTENYDRKLDTSDLFTIQDDVTDHIVATLADKTGVLARSMVQAVQPGAIQQLTSDQLLVRTWGFQHRPSPSMHAELRTEIESRLAADPHNAQLWADLANMYVVEHSLWCNPQPDSLGRALAAARRSIELDHSNQTGWLWLAVTQFHLRDKVAFEEARDRAIGINPRNSYNIAWMGNITAHAGDYERGCALTERSMRLNPAHPGWLHFAVFTRHMAAGEFEQALYAARRANMRDFFWMHFAIAAACGHLGQHADGSAAAAEMTRLAPFLADDATLREFVTRWYWDAAMVERMLEGIENARSSAGSRSEGRSKPPSSTSDAPSPRRNACTVAVQPFTVQGGDSAVGALAEGLTDDVRSGLSRFGHFRVLSGQASERGARYRLEGSVRTTGSGCRLSITLVETQSGQNVWAENFDRDGTEGASQLQDEIANRVIATVGDPTGVLARRMAATIAAVPTDHLTVDELVIRYHAYTDQLQAEEHARLRSGLERALERDPRAAEGWACLSMLYRQEHSQGLNPLPDWMARQRRAAERAIELNSQSQQAWVAMTSAHLFAKDVIAVRGGVERVIAVNPLNSEALALCALYLGAIGDYEEAAALSRRAVACRHQHPGWYRFPLFNFHFMRGEFEEALTVAKTININMPRQPTGYIAAAAASGALGRASAATPALDALADIDPALLDATHARKVWELWILDQDYAERIEQGFRKALAIAGRTVPAPAAVKPPSSGATSPAQGALTVAVLPFVARSSVDDAASMAAGLTDDVTNGLSRFGYLRVLSRSSAGRLAHSPADLQTRARYAVEGNVRHIGSTVRISVTLVDLQTGTNLWTRNYDREADAGPFVIQDEVSNAVVATIGDQTGVLMRAMAGAANRPLDQLLVTELVVRYHLYAEHFDPAEHARLRDALERALEREPTAAEGWASLAFLYQHEYSFGFNPRPDPIGRERRAAERARELDPNSQQAWVAMASVNNCARDREALIHAVDSAASINPLNADLLALGAIYLSVAGEHDRAMSLVQQAMRLKPQHAGWYYYPPLYAAYDRGDYEEALRSAKRINMPRMPLQHANIAALAGHLGLEAEARAALRALRDIDPHFAEPEAVRALWAGWTWSESSISSLIDGLKKALQLETRSDSRSGIRPADPSIAVLPFNDLSEKKDQEWFCDGIAEEILSALSLLPGLRVAARASSFFFKGRSDDLRTIGEKLNVENVLEGSVRRAGDRVRITTQLSDAREGRQLWSERFDRELKDIFDVQDEIARAIAERLRITLTAHRERLVQKVTTNIEAYELLLQGRTLLTRRGPAITKSVEYFERAVALDERLAEAHAGLAEAYRLMGLYGLARPSEVLPKAKAAVARVLAIDANHPEALATLANIKHAFEWNFAEARELTNRALAADPNFVRGLASGSVMLAMAAAGLPGGDLAALIHSRIAKARRIDPLNPWVMSVESLVYFFTGQIDEAIEAAARSFAADRNNFTANWSRVIAFAGGGYEDEAIDAAAEAFVTFGRHPSILAEVAAIYASRGNLFTAESIFHELSERAKTSYVSGAVRAAVGASAGFAEDARVLLAQAIAERDTFLAFYKLPACRSLRADPGCTQLLNDMVYIKDALR